MKTARKATLILLAFAVLATLPGCKGANSESGGGKINVVCTVYPQYDWVCEIIGNRADSFELTLLVDGRADLHSYQPSFDDRVKISACDLFIYVGGESDDWVEDMLDDATNKRRRVINLLDELGEAAKVEEIIEGMEDDEDDEEEDDEDEPEYDEHVWLSLKNAALFCEVITREISALDPDGAAEYAANLAAYTSALDALDARYAEAVNAAPIRTIIVADRFPFRYLADDYGIDYYAAFPGCSAETEASFDTIVFLAAKADEPTSGAIVVTESSDKSVAAAVRNETAKKDKAIIVLDSMQSVSQNDISRGTSYLSVMESNLGALKEALK
ncbi:MAG: metal ABC transporter substrate-binding protein [Oscillospiraceae bacterium]|jgi:zinc transport system substrate-binding protein|nr:metal ABC transporter substrate-binding protein [Oscillospiraceae bacterium]